MLALMLTPSPASAFNPDLDNLENMAMNDNAENPSLAGDADAAQEAPQTRTAKPTLVAGGGKPLAIIPRTFDDAFRIGRAAVIGKWAPRGWTAEQATLAIMHGAEVGLPPMMSMQKICVINGRPSLWGDAVPAIAMATGLLEDWSEGIDGTGDDMVAFCKVKRRGLPTAVLRTFSVSDAKQAGLWSPEPQIRKQVWENQQRVWKDNQDNDSPWHRHPKRMLAMRARVAFRDAFADAFSGLYIAEELDPEQALDITPERMTIDNPLRDDAEDGRETGDEVAPKQVDPIIGKGGPGPHPLDQESAAALSAEEPDDGAHVHLDGSVTRPGDADHPTEDEFSQSSRPESTPTPKPLRQPRRKAGGETSEPSATKAAPESKAAPAAPDWRTMESKALIRQTGAGYLDYLRAWTMVFGGTAMELRDRYGAERAVRNGLGTPLNADQLAQAKDIAAAAFRRLGGSA